MKIICFANGTTKRITDNQERAIFEASSGTAKHIKIDGEIIAFAAIMRIMDEDAYYTETGRPRPQYENYTAPQLTAPKSEPYTKDRALHAVESIKGGLVQYIAQTEMTPKKEALLNRINRKIEHIKQTDESNMHLSFTDIF